MGAACHNIDSFDVYLAFISLHSIRSVAHTHFSKQAFNRVKIRNLKTGRVIERTFKSGESLEGADVVDVEMQYLYNDGEFRHFMVQDTFEQYQADSKIVGDANLWLKDQDFCTITLWNDMPLAVTPANFVELQIIETDPGIRGDTSGGGGKPAKLG